jgi:hypothetical protein
MFKYEVKETNSWTEAHILSREGWKLIAVSAWGISMPYVFYLRRRLPFLKIGRWVIFALMLSLGFTACDNYAIEPDGQLQGYHIERLDRWLKNGFPLDTTMMYYQHPDPPVPMRQPVIDCLMHGPCKPQTFNIYIPDSIYFKYYP